VGCRRSPRQKTLDREYLDRVRRLEERLRAIENSRSGNWAKPRRPLTKVISLVDALDAVEADRVLALAPPELRYEGMVRAMPVFTAALRSTEFDEQGRGAIANHAPRPASGSRQSKNKG